MDSTSKDVAADFATGGKIYLNNASVSLMPLAGMDAMRDFLRSYNEMGPDSAESAALVSGVLADVRSAVSRIINCHPQELVLTQSTTDGINFVANGLSLAGGSNIIIRGGAHEHHANYYPWLRLQDRTRISDLPIDPDGFFDMDELKAQLGKDTGLVALSHALYNTGAILPVEEIGRMCGSIPFFVDAAQTVGCMDVNVRRIGCDFMSFNGSKWLCGPMGTGLFYCRRESGSLLEPSGIGGESAMLCDGTRLAFKDMPDRFQTGFRNYVGMAGLGASARYLLEFGMDNVRSRNGRLACILREELSGTDGIRLYGPQDPRDRTSIVSFNIRGMEPDEAVRKLEKERIILAVREIFDEKIIRASPHIFNTETEMCRVADAIKKL